MPTLDTKITAVTVYPDRARVTRTGRLELEPGAHSVPIVHLPRALEESSVRAAGKGNARLTGVQLKRQVDEQAQQGPAKDAQDQWQALLDQDKILADEQDAWTQRLAVVKNIGEQGGENFARSVARGKLALTDLTDALDYLSQSHEAATLILRDLIIRRRELVKQIQAAKQEADKLQNAAALESYTAHVNLQVLAKDEIEIELTYSVYGASWNSLYDARLADGLLEWTYLAQVRQQTGEAWELPYALALSTASLATGLDKPELPTWRVDMERPPMPRVRQMRAMEPMMAAAPAPVPELMMMEAAPAKAKMQYDDAMIENTGPGVTYKISAPRDIPSDGEPHQVAITSMHLNAKLDYFCAPKVDEHAFIRTTFTNPSEYVMLAGQVNLYHGADFVGTRHTDTIVPQQDVEFFLGAEERIDIERKEIKRSVEKNFLGNTSRTILAYRITAQNPALDVVHLTVLDQIPVSAHPDIRVKPGRITPEATPNDLGEIKWECDLARGGKLEFEFEVTIEYPKEMRVVGV